MIRNFYNVLICVLGVDYFKAKKCVFYKIIARESRQTWSCGQRTTVSAGTAEKTGSTASWNVFNGRQEQRRTGTSSAVCRHGRELECDLQGLSLAASTNVVRRGQVRLRASTCSLPGSNTVRQDRYEVAHVRFGSGLEQDRPYLLARDHKRV